MPSLSKRIEVLEKAVLPARREREEIIKGALSNISLTDVELLISSYGANRVGRSLNESESAARSRYSATIKKQCHWSRSPLIGRFSWELDDSHIFEAKLILLKHRFSFEKVELIGRGRDAEEQDRDPTAEELSAMQAFRSLCDRLEQLAKYGAVTES